MIGMDPDQAMPCIDHCCIFFLLLCLGGIRWKALAVVIGRVSIPFYLYPAQSRMSMRPLLSWTQPVDASALLVARS